MNRAAAAVTWAMAWLTWPYLTRQLRREGWHRVGWATWESPDPISGGTTWIHPTKATP